MREWSCWHPRPMGALRSGPDGFQEHLFRDSLLLAEAPRVLAQVRIGHCGAGHGLALEHLASAAEAQELGDGRFFAEHAKERFHVPLRRVPLQSVSPGQLLGATEAGGQTALARPDEDSLLGDPSQRRHELLAHDAAVAPPLGKRSPTRDPTALLRHAWCAKGIFETNKPYSQ